MNYDPVEVTIDQLIRHYRLREWQYDIEECVEDIAEALKLIGAAKVYINDSAIIVVNGMLAPLPKGHLHVKHLIPVSMPYRETGSFIEIDLPDGTEIEVAFTKMPLDTRGYPLVPDDPSVRAALVAYMVRVLILQGEIKHIGMNFADPEWHWRCRSARAALNTWNLAQANRAYNDYVRLNPLKDVHLKEYLELGKHNTLNRERSRDQFRTR